MSPSLTTAVLHALSSTNADTLENVAIPIFTTGIVFAVTAAIVGMALYARYRHRRLRFETVRFAIEKGAPVPENLLRDPPAHDAPSRDLRRGLVLSGLGLGVGLFLRILQATASNGVWSVGFIPLLLGAGYLITWYLTRRGAGAASP